MSKYYEINEQTARTAKEMNSFSDYRANSATDDYRAAVNEVYKLAEEVAETRPENAEKAAMLAARYARKYAEWVNKSNRIDTMCPSILICGGGNFPTRKKEKQNAARDRLYADYNDIEAIKQKIDNLKYAPRVIKSDDENALEKLREKLAKAEALQAEMKVVNAYYKKNGTLKGYKEYSDEKAAELDAAILESLYKKPFAPYALTNNSAEIRRIKARITELERLKNEAESAADEPQTEYDTDICRVVENAEIMRLQLFFDGKPSDAIRTVLKRNAYKWSPSQGCWQRQLTDNARHGLKRMIAEIGAL